MKFNPWTVTLAATGMVSLVAVSQAEESQHQVMTALASTTLSGYVDTSAIWKFGTGNGALPGRSYDGPAKQDGFNLNVVKLQLAKALDESQWAAGYNVGLLFGPDANALNATSTGPFFNTSDFAIKEANVVLRAPVGNGLDIKLGVWDTVIGYEVFEAGSNPNYSRSFGFALEPKIHTGVLASYRVNDVLSVAGGVANRGDINNINQRAGVESLKSYLGSITLTAPESMGALKGAALYAGVVDAGVSGLTPTPAGRVAPYATNNKNPVNYYAGLYLPTPVTGLSAGAAYDYRANGLFDSSYENAAAAYVTYRATEKLKLADRVEYATGSNGAWGVGVAAPSRNVELFANTATLDYSLWANTITRLEFRWDHSLTGQSVFNLFSSDGGSPNRNAVSLALNVIYQF